MGGDGWAGDEAGTKTEMYPRSKRDLPAFPLSLLTLHGAVGFNTAQGPVFCGGANDRTIENRCFILKQHQWMPFPSMTTRRKSATATEINNDRTLIIGGNFNDLKSTEFVSASGSEVGEKFPVTISGHCTFKINATHALVTGGIQDGSDSASTWFVDLTTTTSTPGPAMKMRR